MPLHYEVVDRIAYFTIDRPEAHNAIDVEMFETFERRILEFADDPDAWVAIVTGAGRAAFTTGVDLGTAMPTLFTAQTKRSPPTQRILTFKGTEIWKPVIAAVNGYCLGGGTEMLLGMDIRIATPEASFGLPEVRWGVTARGGSTVRLPRQIPWAVAMEMLLTGERIDARRAYEVGLINKIVEYDELMPTAQAYAHRILENGPLAVRAIKESVHRTSGVPLTFGYELDFRIVEPAFSSEDAREGPIAFIEKRRPRFTGS